MTASLTPVRVPEYAIAGGEAYTNDLKLAGYANGHMPSDRMMTVDGCTLERDAAYLYSKMVDAAKEDGIRLGWEDCYRSYNTQASAYERRCPYVQTGTQKTRECKGAPLAPAGASNHGWGRAVDFTNHHDTVLGCNDIEYEWLQNNAYRFGWVHPDWAECGRKSQEPWHWEYAGVIDRTLVRFVTIDPNLVANLE
jgi:LAS superfamily LD-carboxypeptidase LdcB